VTWNEETRARLADLVKTVDSIRIEGKPPVRMELSDESSDAIRAALAEIERLSRRLEHEATAYRVAEEHAKSLLAQRDELTRELLEENERHAATTAEVERLRALALDEAHAHANEFYYRKAGIEDVMRMADRLKTAEARVRTLEEALDGLEKL
jgi:wyosine [tRNA(Phe)-imidazoG37] synthetase (radical SAM superfamily)